MTAVYDPKEFAEWLSDAFRKSPFKSWRELAARIGTSVSTVTRYAGAKPQYLTSKPSQPSPDLVIKLAEAFDDDVDAVLEKAGHAAVNPRSGKPQNAAEFVQRLSDMGFDIQTNFDYEKLGPDELQDIIDDIEAKLLVKIARRNKG